MVCKSKKCCEDAEKKKHNPFMRIDSRYVQRDVNAAKNIRHFAMEMISLKGRPEYLTSREEQ